jgi:hypothetical protein
MSKLESIRSNLDSLEGLFQKSGAVAPSMPAGKAGNAKKTPKAPNSWILFTSRVRSVIKDSGVLGEKKLGKECQQFCGYLRAEFSDLDSWTAEAILARFSGWTVPEKSKMAIAGLTYKEDKKNTPEQKEKRAAKKIHDLENNHILNAVGTNRL